MSESKSIEETIFLHARQLPSAERAAYLTKACDDDRALRERIERLLNAERAADEFLASDPLQLNQTAVVDGAETDASGSRIGPYKLLQPIGEGGCGIVYMAEQEQPIRRRVALKVIKPGMDSRQVIARFEVERQALAMMDHPNIARVLDAGTTELGRPYFVMELVRGVRITDYCDQNNLSTGERLDLFIKVVQAVQHAHQKGIIHRDLKPSNVLVTLHDGVPVPKVIDFGVAKALEQKLTDKTLFTQFEQFIGTPAYTSPEQAEMSGLDIDTRSDIYSLGVLLYELLVGKTPFDAQELVHSGLDEMRRIIREKEPALPSTRLSTMLAEERTASAQRRSVSLPQLIHLLNGDLDWIAMKCLEKDRTRRYHTATGLADDLQHYLSNEPVSARSPSNVYRLGKLVRRNKLAFAAGTAILVALVAGMVVSAWQASRASRAEQVATEEKESAEAVLQFFRDKILAAGRPKGQKGGLGKDATLRQAIDAAEAEIGKSFSNRPLVEASIRKTIGESYQYLGEPTLAIPQLERALALRQQSLGLLHDRTDSALESLHRARTSIGRSDQDLPLYEEIFKLNKAKHGAAHPDTLTAMHGLAMVYWGAGKLDPAVTLLEDTLKMRQATLERGHQSTLTTMNDLSLVYQSLGKLEPAVRLLEETLDLEKAKLGKDHDETLITMQNLVAVYQHAGKMHQAMALAQEAFELAKARHGPEHPDTLAKMQGVAHACQYVGRHEQALRLFEETLELRKARLGLQHPDTLDTMSRLAAAYLHAKDYDQALPRLQEVFQMQKARLGPDHRQTLFTMNALAIATEYSTPKRIDQALPLYDETLKRMKATDHPDTLTALNNLAGVYTARGNLAQAEALYREHLGRKDTGRAAAFGLARVLFELSKTDNVDPARARKRVAEGEQLLRETLDLERAYHANNGPALRGRLSETADLFRHIGSFDKAAALFEESLALKNDSLTATLGLARTLFEWANADLTNSTSVEARRARALQLTRHHLALIRVRHANDVLEWEKSIGDIAELQCRHGYYAEAEPLYREVLQSQSARLDSRDKEVMGTTATLARLLADWAWAERANVLASDARRLISSSSQPSTTRGGTADQSLVTSAATTPHERAREAERLLRECLAAHLNGASQTNWRVDDVMSRLGSALVSVAATVPPLSAAEREAKLSEAEVLLLEAHQRLHERKFADKQYKRDVIERLVRLYEAWGDPEQRAAWQRKLDRFGQPGTEAGPTEKNGP